MLYSSPLARRSPGQLPFFVTPPYGRSKKVPETNPPPAAIGVTIARREAHSSPDRPVPVSSTCVERSLKGYHHQVSRPESNLTGWLQLATRMRLVWSGLVWHETGAGAEAENPPLPKDMLKASVI